MRATFYRIHAKPISNWKHTPKPLLTLLFYLLTKLDRHVSYFLLIPSEIRQCLVKIKVEAPPNKLAIPRISPNLYTIGQAPSVDKPFTFSSVFRCGRPSLGSGTLPNDMGGGWRSGGSTAKRLSGQCHCQSLPVLYKWEKPGKSALQALQVTSDRVTRQYGGQE